MKAISYPDGRIEFDGTPEEITATIARQRPERQPLLLPAHVPTITSITNLSQETRVHSAILAEPGRTFTIREVCKAIGMTEANRASISTVLAKLARDGAITRVGHGQYTGR